AGLMGGQFPVIWSVRDDLHRSMSPVTRATIRSCALLSRWLPQVILFNSQTSLESHVGVGYAPDRARVIPNGFDLTKFSPDDHQRRQVRSALGVAESEILIAMFARYMHGKKDHRSFIQAAGMLAQRRPN